MCSRRVAIRGRRPAVAGICRCPVLSFGNSSITCSINRTHDRLEFEHKSEPAKRKARQMTVLDTREVLAAPVRAGALPPVCGATAVSRAAEPAAARRGADALPRSRRGDVPRLASQAPHHARHHRRTGPARRADHGVARRGGPVRRGRRHHRLIDAGAQHARRGPGAGGGDACSRSPTGSRPMRPSRTSSTASANSTNSSPRRSTPGRR